MAERMSPAEDVPELKIPQTVFPSQSWRTTMERSRWELPTPPSSRWEGFSTVRFSLEGLTMPHRLATRVILLLCFLCPLPVAAQDSPAVDSVATLYRKARAAAIEVLVNDHLNGSGVLVDKSGLAITAAHVVGRPGSRVEVLTADVVRRKAEVVAVDLGHDTAVLKVELGQQVMAAAPLAAQLPVPGEELYLLGAPVYRHGVMLRGAMAREGATFEYCGEHYVAVIQIAATAQPGTSGGAWFNRRGEVVSLQSSVMSSNGVPIGIAFGSLASAARALLETQRTAATPTLGAAL